MGAVQCCQSGNPLCCTHSPTSHILCNPGLPHIKISLWGLERAEEKERGGGAEAQLQPAREEGGSRAADRLTPASALFTVPPSTWAQQGGESAGLEAETPTTLTISDTKPN